MYLCDMCSTAIAAGEGYAVYCRAGFMVPGAESLLELGDMLICENCADELFTETTWNETSPMAVELDLSLDRDAMKHRVTLVNYQSIAMRAKKRGLNPTQARQEAREIAELWWKDKGAAVERLKSLSL